MNHAAQINKALIRLGRLENEFETACEVQARAEHAYKMRFAREFLAATGGVEDRKQSATLACESESEARVAADARRDVLMVLIADCRAAMSARQSILSAESRNFEVTKKLTA